jgi:cyclophilin family peptidyl-prolyl cis-trans isomerase
MKLLHCLSLATLLVALPLSVAIAQAPAAKATKKAAEKGEKPASEAKAEPAEEPKTPGEKFQAVHREWKSLDKRLTELQQTYSETPSPAARAELKKQYEALVEQSTQLLPELHEAALAAYEAEPNKDSEVVRTLIGIVAYAFRRDDYEAALELARLLEKGECEEPVLYAIAGQAAFNADDYETAESWLTRADKAGKLDADGKRVLGLLLQQKEAWADELAVRKAEAEADDLPQVKLETTKGPITIELFENEAPQTVGNFVSLVESKFYDGLTFHRVLPGFMAQGGDPNGDGSGDPGYSIYCECDKENARQHFRGTMSMAHAGKDTGGSQFFLTFAPTTHLNGRHTAFGRVIDGMDVLAKLQRRDPTRAGQPEPDKILKAEVLRKRDHKYEPVKVK